MDRQLNQSISKRTGLVVCRGESPSKTSEGQPPANSWETVIKVGSADPAEELQSD